MVPAAATRRSRLLRRGLHLRLHHLRLSAVGRRSSASRARTTTSSCSATRPLPASRRWYSAYGHNWQKPSAEAALGARRGLHPRGSGPRARLHRPRHHRAGQAAEHRLRPRRRPSPRGRPHLRLPDLAAVRLADDRQDGHRLRRPPPRRRSADRGGGRALRGSRPNQLGDHHHHRGHRDLHRRLAPLPAVLRPLLRAALRARRLPREARSRTSRAWTSRKAETPSSPRSTATSPRPWTSRTSPYS